MPAGCTVTTGNQTPIAGIPIATLIVDDDRLFRQAVRQLLEQAPEIRVVGEATDGEEAIRLTQELRPDLVLMDITMPRMDGLEATRRIKAERPDVKVIILTVHQEEAYRTTACERGADAFLTKKTVGTQLLPAITGI